MNIPNRSIPKQTQLFYGADYNPDQWQHAPEILERDIELMKQAGVTSASVGIFAWTALEPEEGRYTFEWLDRVMDRFAQEGMFVFLATPSGSKPMWLSEKYPEVRRVNQDGIRDRSGGRHNHCMSSQVYRAKTAQMNRALAERYQNHPALALWHVGNEFSGECHCQLCRTGFQEWLKAKYQTLEALNEAWWSNFWNHTFTDWSQVPTFDESIDGLSLDWLRFTNDQHVSFFRNEMVPLRELTPHVPCTTNFMGTHEGTNYWQWSEHLDVISNDLYPMPDDREHTWQQSIASDFIHSLMRGMSGGKPWMLLECSPSSVNWGQINKLKRPGVHRQEVLQAVANGADTIHYFQWRKGRGGFEKYHGAVVDHEGSDRGRVYQECAAVGSELASLESLCQQDLPKGDVAIVYDWESRWALNASCGPKKAEAVHPYPSDIYTEACQAHYRALTVAGQSVDVLSAQSEFTDYKVLVIPALYMVSDALGARLQAFVDRGGILVGSYLTGYVDEMNRCHLGGFPGAGLRDTFGIWNEEVDYLHDETEVLIAAESGEAYPDAAKDIVEVLHADSAEVLARTASEFYSGSPIVTRKQSGAGAAYYVGAKLGDGGLNAFYQQLLSAHDLHSNLQMIMPEGVVLRQRESAQGRLTFLFNYKREAQSIELLDQSLRDLATGDLLSGHVELQPYASHVCVAEEGSNIAV